MTIVPVTDLKQWAYCQRIVYYRQVMPGIARPTYKMEEAKGAQELIESLEMRRTLRRYGLEDGRRRFGLWLKDDGLALSGKIDLLIETERESAIVDFKLTSGEPGENHRFQLAGYALLAHGALGVEVSRGLIYRIPDGKVFEVAISQGLRDAVREALSAMRRHAAEEILPDATPIRGRCRECEYQNYCADVW
jgi:CRISPR-associated exonuclease Cas4